MVSVKVGDDGVIIITLDSETAKDLKYCLYNLTGELKKLYEKLEEILPEGTD